MIRPLDNARRSARDLSGVWHIAFDPDESGEAQGWHRGLARESALPIAVPGSWNEQLAEVGYMNYVGSAWLETRFWLQPLGPGDEAVLRFGSVDYHAEVWVNGQPAGRSGAAMLPFEVPLDGLAKPGSEVTLVVRVSNLLPVDGLPRRISARRAVRFLPLWRDQSPGSSHHPAQGGVKGLPAGHRHGGA